MELEQQLIQAAADGNENKLNEILQEHPHSLDRFLVGRFNWTPLHVAAARDHHQFVSHVLNITPELIDLIDSRNRSALHLASAKGKTEAAKILVSACPELCLSRDIDGRNPLHLAAMGGHTEVLEILVNECPHAARVPADQGETILHLCVKGRKVEALEVLVKSVVGIDAELLNAKDGHGNTILHLAAAGQAADGKAAAGQYVAGQYVAGQAVAGQAVDGQSVAGQYVAGQAVDGQYAAGQDAADHTKEMTKMLGYLLKDKRVEVNVMNMDGKTVLDIVKEIPKGNEDMVAIVRDLADRGALTGRDMARGEWLSKQQESLMVVASLIATMAFQAGVSPPGGVWQDDQNGHHAGEAVLAYNYPETYPYFLRANTIGFVASLSTILLLISGLPFRRRSHMWILVVIMWLTITAMAFTYAFSIVAITPKKRRGPMRRTMYVAIPVWCFVMLVLFVFHSIRLLMKMRKDEKNRKWTGTANDPNCNSLFERIQRIFKV